MIVLAIITSNGVLSRKYSVFSLNFNANNYVNFSVAVKFYQMIQGKLIGSWTQSQHPLIRKLNWLLKNIYKINRIFPKNSFDARNRIRIFIRFIMHLCNAYRDEKSKYTEDIVTIPQIASIYIKLMRFGADVFVKDVELMHVWYRFTKINPKLLSELLK